MSRCVVERAYFIAKAPEDIRELWPQATQIVACRIRYEPRHPKWQARAEEVHYYLLTGPPGAKPLSAKRLADLIRGHWRIENQLHHVKDRTFREDDQQVRCGAIALCWLRTVALSVLQGVQQAACGKRRYIPELRAHFNAHPRKAVALIRKK